MGPFSPNQTRESPVLGPRVRIGDTGQQIVIGRTVVSIQEPCLGDRGNSARSSETVGAFVVHVVQRLRCFRESNWFRICASAHFTMDLLS
jgi:hypothetical protein